MESELCIKKQTEHYKQYIYEPKNGWSYTTPWMSEAVIFTNGIRVIFRFSVFYDYRGITLLEKFSNIEKMQILVNDEETQDKKLREKVYDYLHDNYFDEDVYDTFQAIVDYDNYPNTVK